MSHQILDPFRREKWRQWATVVPMKCREENNSPLGFCASIPEPLVRHRLDPAFPFWDHDGPIHSGNGLPPPWLLFPLIMEVLKNAQESGQGQRSRIFKEEPRLFRDLSR